MTLAIHPITAHLHCTVVFACICDHGLHGRQATRVGQWPHLAGAVQAIANLQGACVVAESLNKFFVNPLLH